MTKNRIKTYLKLLRQPQLLTVFILFIIVVLNFSAFNFLAPLDRTGGDFLLSLQAKGRTPPDNIVLVNIDQASLDHPQMLELAGSWPWARVVHGELVSYLAKQGARAIIFDVSFSEPDVFNLNSDQAFAKAIESSNTPVYLPLVIPEDGMGSVLKDLPSIMGITRTADADGSARLPLLAPKALPPSTWRTGHINFLMDTDQIGRRAELYRKFSGWSIPSLAGRVAHDQGAAIPNQQNIILHWYGKPFTSISYHDVYLKSLTSDARPSHDLLNKVIIIGSTAPGLVDFRPTPLGTRTPGQDVLATTLANLQQSDWLVMGSPNWSIALALILICLGAIGVQKGVHPLLLGLIGIILSLIFIATAYVLLDKNVQWHPFSALAISWIALIGLATESFIQEKRRRREAVLLFNRFLDPRVVKQLTSQTNLVDAEASHSQEITVLFSDIRGFTTLSESRTPEEIVSLLNRYFNQMVEVIFEHNGTLDKFIGDAIMAFWGAPVDTPDHAIKAVSAALAMSDRLEMFQKSLDHPFEIGIGIHTGDAVVGFIGSSRRLDYTAIGDAVNLASRIEGETKGVARILVSESTRDACGDAFDFIYYNEVNVKGRAQSVRLFEPRRK